MNVAGTRRIIEEDLLTDLAALSIGGFVSFSLIVWDFLCYLPDEIRLFKDFRKIEWRSLNPWALLLSRYSALIYAILVLFNLTLKAENCQLVSSMAQIVSIGVVACGGALATQRTITLWSNERSVMASLGAIYSATLICWIAAATQHRAVRLSTALPGFGTNCRPLALPSWSPIGYGCSSILSILILVLVIYRLVAQRTDRVLNTGLTPLNRACVWYLLVNATTSTVLFVVSVNWHSEWTTDTAKRIASPFFVVLLAATNQRMWLNSHADNMLRKRRVQELTNIEPPVRQSTPRSSPRWSFVPTRKPVPQMEENALQYQSSTRPSQSSRPSVPVSPLPPQHISSLEKLRTTSMSSRSGSSSIGKSPSPESDISTLPPTSPNTVTIPDSRITTVGSPVSTIGFSSPPGSPQVLGLPWPGKQTTQGGKRSRQRQTASSFGSVFSSQPETPGRSLTRLPSGKSGWVS